MSWRKPNKASLVICLLLCNQVYMVVAATASECSVAIVAAVFGTIATMLLIAAIAALIWYCYRKRRSGSTGSASVETASEQEIEFGTKTKRNGFDMGLDGQPVTFSHHYSEIAPSAAYNTSGVVNPAFAGSQEVLQGMPAARKGIENPAFSGNREVKVDIPQFGTDEVAIDMDGDPSHRADLPDGKLSTGFPSGSIEGLDADVEVKDPHVPKLDMSGPDDVQTVDVTLDRPESGGFGLLIARDKALPPPALFVREVTQGGVAEKTGLIHGGDKIIGINGVSVEGMPHGKAMELLRGSKSPMLNLKLLKLGGNINAKAPCTVNVENELKAAIPKADFEGGIDIPSNQGNLDVPRPNVSLPDGKMSVKGSELDVDSGNWDVSAKAPRPGLGIGTPEMKGPQGNLRANVSGPDIGVSTDRPKGPKGNTGVPSVDLDLPSKKKTQGKCFSCASSPEKNEPYERAHVRGKGQYDFNAPDVDQSFEMKRFGDVNIPGPDFSVEGTDRKVELRASRPDIDIATGNRDIPDASVSMPSASLEGDVDFDSSGPNADVSFKKPQGGIKTPQSNVEGQISGPSVDLSGPEMRGPKANINVPNMPAAGKPKGEPDVNYGMKLSGPDADISGPKVRDRKARVSGPSAGANVPQSKKKGAKCLSCTGSSDKDEPYKKTGGKAEFDSDRPEMTGSFDVNKPGIRGSRPTFDGPEVRGLEKDIDLRAIGPDINIHNQAPFEDIEISGPGMSLPSASKRGDVDFGASVPDVDIPKRKLGAELRTKHADIEVPGVSSAANISGPDADLSVPQVRSPEANTNASFADTSLPSTKKKGASCLSCAKSGDRDEPYRKAKSTGHFDFDRPEVHGSMKMKKSSTFDVRESAPDVDGRLGNRNVSVNAAGPSQNADISLHSASGGDLDLGASGPNIDISARKPQAKFDTTSPETRSPKGAVPKANIATPSADMKLPSSEKKLGNCLSCTPGAEKDEPYRKRGSGADLRFDKPDIDDSMDLKMDRNVDVDRSVPDVGGFKGKGINEEVKLRTATPYMDIPKGNLDGNTNLPRPNVFKPSTSGVEKMSVPSVDGEDVHLDLSKPNVQIVSKKPRGRPDTDADLPKGKLDGSVSGPDFDGFDPNLSSSGPDLDIRKGSLDLDIENSRPNVSMPSVNGGNLDFDANVPNEDISGNKPQVKLDTDSLDLGKRKDSFDLNGSSDLDLDDFWNKDRLDLPTSGLDIDIPNVNLDKDIDLSGDFSIPSKVQENFSIPLVSDGGFDGPSADFSTRKPRVDLNDRRPSGLKPVLDGLGGRGINEDYDIPKGDLDTDRDISGLRASLPSGRQEGTFSVPLTEQDLTGPSVDVSKTKPRIGVELDGPTGDFEWGGKTSTPKRHVSGKPRFDLTNVERDVHGDNVCDNVELASPPEGFRNDAATASPKVYEEPRNLFRYDEIRPEMNLKLYSPDATGSINGVAEPQTSTPSVTLVKVEENVSVYSASLQEEPASPSKSIMFVLDRKVHQKLEIVVPDEDDRGASQSSPPLKKSSSSSSSSSSDDEMDKKRKSRQKRKFRLPKLGRKGSTSSKSSQEKDGAKSLDSPITKARRKSSASSSSSDDDSVAKPMQRGGTIETHPPPSELNIPLTTSAKQKSEDTSSSSSSDEAASVIYQANIPKRESSKSSSSSSEDEDSRNKKSPEEKPAGQDFSLRGKFETPKPAPDVILAKQEDKRERKESTSSSSSSDEDVTKKKGLPSTRFVQKTEYDVHPHLLTVASDEPSAVHEDLPEVVFNSTKPVSPDFSFMASDDLPSRERRSSTSSSSSSDEESTKDEERTAPTEGHDREDQGEPVSLATPVEEEAPEPASRHKEPTDLDFSFMLQTSEVPVKETQESKLRKSSTSSSSSSDDEVMSKKQQIKLQERKSSTSSSSSNEEKTSRDSLTLDVRRHEYETVYHVITPDYPTNGPEADNSEVQVHAPIVVTRSIKRTTPDFSDEEHEDLQTHFHIKDVTEDTHYQVEYPYNVTRRTHDTDSTIKDQEEPVTAIVSPLVKSEIPDYSVLFMQHDEPEAIDIGDEDHKMDLLPSDNDGRQSPSLDVQVHRYETVYHVIRHEYPSVSQEAEGSEVREDSPIVVSRSLQRPNLDVDETGSPGEDELHDTPHFVSSVQHVSYSEPSLDYKATGRPLVEGHYWKEEWITASKRSVEEFTPNIHLLLASSEEPGDVEKPGENATKEEEPSETPSPDRGNEKGADIKRKGSTSRIWDLLPGYLIAEPVLGDDAEPKTTEGVPESSIQDDDQRKVTERHVDLLKSLPNSEGAVSGSLQTEPVTLTVQPQTVHVAKNGLQAPILEPEFKDQMREFKEVSVIIETRPKVTDDQPVMKEEPPAPELNEIQLEAIPKSEDDVSHGLPSETFTVKTLQVTKESPQMSVSGPQFQEAALTIESRTKVEGAQPVIEEEKPEFDKQDKTKPKVRESLLESVPKTADDVSADTQPQKVFITKTSTHVSSSGPQYKEVAFTIEPKKAVTEDKPDVKEASIPSWKRHRKPPAEDVDSPEDPWMRHYSKGLERGYSYQPTYRRTSFGRSPETNTSFSQSRSISLSKVPHVRELKVTGDRGRDRPRYMVQTRTQVTGNVDRGRGTSPVRRGQSSETTPLSELLSVWERETSPRTRQRNTYR